MAFLMILAVLLGSAGMPQKALGIELSLEENRAEQGSIGYVDMKMIFDTYPETLKAKQEFEEEVDSAEDGVNSKKAEVLRLRHKIEELKMQREFIATTPMAVSTAAFQPVPAPSAPAPAPAPAAQEPAKPSLPSLPGMSVAPSTAAVISSTAAELSSSSAALNSTQAVAVSSAAPAPQVNPQPSAPVAVSPPAAAPAPQQVLVSSSIAALGALDAQIDALSKELDQKSSDYKQNETTTERNLLDLENRKTQVILGKMYKAIQIVAKQEGISVVVDKSSILYGLTAVDMTQKVIDYMKANP